MRALLVKEPRLDSAKLERTVKLINASVPDCLVTGYGHLIDDITLPDPNDRHVLAAAIRIGAGAIVTMNLKDFPDDILGEFEIFTRHPDDFILDLADLEPAVVVRAAKQQRAGLKNPPFSPEEFIEIIRRQGLPGVAAFLEDDIDLI